METAQLVDAFVEKVNAGPRGLESLKDVPEFLRDGTSDEGWTGWLVKKSDNFARIRALEQRLGTEFPASFRDFLSRYSFPAFEFGPLLFFSNTGEDLFWELGKRLFADPHMSPVLLNAGYIQIGNPYFYNYDPICFDTKSRVGECRIVQLDHEAILQSGKLQIVQETAQSFVEFMNGFIKDADG